MENRKITAIEWFLNKLGNVRIHVTEAEEYFIKDIIKQALELEKEQIISAYRKGSDNAVNVYVENGNNIPAKQYYKDTYEKNNI